MNDSRFISSPIHAPIHVDDEMEIKVPVIKEIVNINDEIFSEIKKRKILTSIKRV